MEKKRVDSNLPLAERNTPVEQLQLELKQTLEAIHGKIQVISTATRKGDMRVLFRVFEQSDWLQIVREFLAFERDNSPKWYSFIGQKYMLKGNDVAFAWILIIDSDELAKAVDEIRATLHDIDEQLYGAAANRRFKKPDASRLNFKTASLPQGDLLADVQDRVRPVR